MCGGTPNVPTIPEKQRERLPDGGDVTLRDNAQLRKMRIFAGLRNAALPPPSTTGGATGATTLG